MKAYAIKNKKGKYLDYCQDFETSSICDARLFDNNEEALNFCPKNCEVVEITIAEGDLEQEVEELKTRISELQDKDWYEACIKQLEEQNDKLIKERDRQIKEYSNYFKSFGCKDFAEFQELIGLAKISANDKERDDTIRKQVCDKIRKTYADRNV